jgi:hypothetical protein
MPVLGGERGREALDRLLDVFGCAAVLGWLAGTPILLVLLRVN